MTREVIPPPPSRFELHTARVGVQAMCASADPVTARRGHIMADVLTVDFVRRGLVDAGVVNASLPGWPGRVGVA